MNNSAKMDESPYRKVLVFLWLIFWIVNCSIIIYLYLAKWIEKDNFNASMVMLNSCYAPYIGAMLSFYFLRKAKLKEIFNTERMSFILALTGSLLWNLSIFILEFLLIFQIGTIEESMEIVKSVCIYFSCLVGGGIGYYFGRS